MLTAEQIDALLQPLEDTPNVLDVELRPWRDGERGLFAVAAETRAMAQRIIDAVDDHAHLRGAVILIIQRLGILPDADGHITLGRAAKAGPLHKVLTPGMAPDFIITLNGTTWKALDDRQRLALLDHELSHCAVTIGGKFVGTAKLASFVEELDTDLVAVESEVVNDRDWPLVRYRKRDEQGRPCWRVRKHDVEEFCAVAGRWGAWKGDLAALVDVMEADDGQMDLEYEGRTVSMAEAARQTAPQAAKTG